MHVYVQRLFFFTYYYAYECMQVCAYLLYVGGLATHVRPSDDLKRVLISEEENIVGYECHLILHLH